MQNVHFFKYGKQLQKAQQVPNMCILENKKAVDRLCDSVQGKSVLNSIPGSSTEVSKEIITKLFLLRLSPAVCHKGDDRVLTGNQSEDRNDLT